MSDMDFARIGARKKGCQWVKAAEGRERQWCRAAEGRERQWCSAASGEPCGVVVSKHGA